MASGESRKRVQLRYGGSTGQVGSSAGDGTVHSNSRSSSPSGSTSGKTEARSGARVVDLCGEMFSLGNAFSQSGSCPREVDLHVRV